MLEQRFAGQVSVLLAEAVETSGPIPSSSELYKYSPEHQERILRAYEAGTSDESARRDQIVSTQSELAKKSLWVTPAIWGGAAVCSLVAQGALDSTPLAVAFIAAPVIRAVGAWATSYTLGQKASGGDE
ncbi:MAG: hypothetical protein LBH13_06425 [Cellulomonadaceae bacterium]|nr:hypothetical protein [Cellulomonadaceae bacterium]